MSYPKPHSDNLEQPTFTNGFGTESPLDHAFAILDAAAPPIAKRGKTVVACRADEIEPGGKRIVEVEGFSVGIFNLDGKYFAVKNVCPHAAAPLCQGHIQTTHRPSEVGEFDPAFEGRILRCPWHGWEFDIVTGKGLYDQQGRVATYATEVDESGMLLLKL